jgi:type I restriction enzyme S subunit
MIATEVKYKKTGVEWIPDIPDHWEVRRLKQFSKIETGTTPPKIDNSNYSEKGIPWIKPDNLNDFEPLSDSKERISKDGLKGARLIPKDSVLVCCIGTIGKIGIAGVDLTTNQQINSVIFNRDIVLPSFGKYLIFSSEKEHWRISTKSVVSILNKSAQGSIKFPIPPLDEQFTIANYLDVQCEKTKRFIQTKQRFIELLKEQRQSIITNAVTKGIDEKTKMKETGIEWMPEVPEHWETRKIRRIFDGMSSGTTPESGNMKYYENGQTNWINTGDLNDGLLTDCKYKVTKRALEDYPTLKVYPIGTILVAMYGATIGKVSLMEIEGCTNQACCALYDSKIYIKEFSLFSLLAAKDALIREGYGGGQPNISQDVIKRFKLPVPPSVEQKRIVEHIKIETKTLDIAISKTEREIELIKEYREAMIAEAVTGKMKL